MAVSLWITIDRAERGHSVLAEYANRTVTFEVDPLPSDFKNSLVILQGAMLSSAAAKAATYRPGRHDYGIAPSPDDEPIGEGHDDWSSRTTSRVLRKRGAPKQPSRAQQRPRHNLVERSDEKIIREIGTQLFNHFVAKGVNELYEAACHEAELAGEPLEIRLSCLDTRLTHVPWETLHDTKNVALTTSNDRLFVRAINRQESTVTPPRRGQIRILVMAAKPRTIGGAALDCLDASAEQRAIKEALATIKKVSLVWLPRTRSRDLLRAFRQVGPDSRWDVFHFIGHGGYDPDERKGYIIVQEDGGSRGRRLYADDLATSLTAPGRIPYLVILNSCSGANSTPGEIFGSTAEVLIRRGVPAVIAMQFDVSDNMAIAFSEALYTYLSYPLTLQAALASTRLDLKMHEFGEWVAPVLYMKSRDSHIFSPEVDEHAAGGPAA